MCRAAALLMLFGSLTMSAHASRPISETARDLYLEWEQVQVSSVRAWARASRDDESSGLAVYLLLDESSACDRYRLQLSGNEYSSGEPHFSPVAGGCAVYTLSPVAGTYQLTLVRQGDEGQAEALLDQRLNLTAGSREISIERRTGPLGVRLHAEAWPRSQATPWWRAAVDLVPGLGDTATPAVRQLRQRPQWRLVVRACEEGGAGQQTLARLFSMLGQVPAQDYGAEEMQVLAECALAAGWPQTAQMALAHWQTFEAMTDERAEAQLQLARLQYRIGDVETVAQLSLRSSEPDLQTRSKHLKSMALMALARHAEAAKLLLTGAHLGSPVGAAPGDHDDPSLFMRYNLAMALLASQQREKAWAVLDALGQITATEPHAQALIDRANLLLGWQFLDVGSAASAAPVFQRVSTEGAFARQALLGLGWSWVLDPGKPLRRVAEPVASRPVERSAAVLKALYLHDKISCEEYRRALGDDAACLRSARFLRAEEQTDVQRRATAADHWIQLLQLDLLDSASIEAAIALAEVAAQRGQTQAAIGLMERAIAAIERQLKALEQSKDDDAQEHLASLPELQLAMMEPEAVLLRSLQGAMSSPQVELDQARQALRSALQKKVQRHLAQWAQDKRQQLHGQLRTYLIDARVKYAEMMASQS